MESWLFFCQNNSFATRCKSCGSRGLFGPTDAKNEFKNLLADNHHFNEIEIELVNTAKMSDPEMHAFMKAHFRQKQAII